VADQAHRKRNIMENEGATDIEGNLPGSSIRMIEEVAQVLNRYSEKFPESLNHAKNPRMDNDRFQRAYSDKASSLRF